MRRSTSAGRRVSPRSASGTSPRPGSRAAARSTMADLIRTFRLLNAEQRTAAVGAVLLAVSTFGPFSFVEAAELLIAFGGLALLRARAQRPPDDLPQEHRTPRIRRRPRPPARRRSAAAAARGGADDETEP